MESLEKYKVSGDFMHNHESTTLSFPNINPAMYYNKLTDTLRKVDLNTIFQAIIIIQEAWKKRRQIICFGNGGSAFTAQHFINDWNKSIFLSSGKQFRGRCLTENIGLITSYANDISYEDIFVEQLKNILEPEDLVIGISGSGNSENVLRAIDYSNKNGHPTIGLCGFDGGKLKQLAKYVVWVPINDMQISEDIHFTFGHLVMQSLCKY